MKTTASTFSELTGALLCIFILGLSLLTVTSVHSSYSDHLKVNGKVFVLPVTTTSNSEIIWD
jgi:hypothetical protein